MKHFAGIMLLDLFYRYWPFILFLKNESLNIELNKFLNEDEIHLNLFCSFLFHVDIFASQGSKNCQIIDTNRCHRSCSRQFFSIIQGKKSLFIRLLAISNL